MTFQNRGFTLIEAMLGMMVLLTGVAVMLPAFTRDLIVGGMLRERRLAVKLIESDLDWACNMVRMPTPYTTPVNPTALSNPPLDDFNVGADFDELRPGIFPPLTPPAELYNVTANRQVTCLDSTLADRGMNANGTCPGGETLKRVRVTVTWRSRNGNLVSEPSNGIGTDYLISRVGLCGS